MKEEKSQHAILQNIAIYWLYGRGCSIFGQEVPVGYEIVDALGLKYDEYGKHGTVYSIEAKASRSDLICAKQKGCYENSLHHPHADFYYLIVAEGITVEKELYPMWGVINCEGRVVRKAKRMIPHENHDQFKLSRAIAHVLVYKVFGKLYMR